MLWKIGKVGKDQTIDFAAEELRRYLLRIDTNSEVAILSFNRILPQLQDVL